MIVLAGIRRTLAQSTDLEQIPDLYERFRILYGGRNSVLCIR